MAQGLPLSAGPARRRLGIAAVAAILALALSPAAARGLELRYPGSMWSEFRFPSASVPEERNDYVFEGAVEQGIDWVKFHKRYTVNTFADFRFTVDKEKLDYTNRLMPGVGLKLKVAVGPGIVQVGVKGAYEDRFESRRRSSFVYGFVNWWFGWDLKGN